MDEKKLEELVSNMDDRIRMHDYSKEQLLLLIEDYVTINFQGMKYQTREAILNMICDAVNYYDIGKDLKFPPDTFFFICSYFFIYSYFSISS